MVSTLFGSLLVVLLISYFQIINQLVDVYPDLIWQEFFSGVLGLAMVGTVLVTCRKCV